MTMKEEALLRVLQWKQRKIKTHNTKISQTIMCTGNKATQICAYRYLTCLMSHDYTFYVVDAQIRTVLHHKRDYIHCVFNEITSGEGETIIITYIWGPTCNIENLQKKRHFQSNPKLDMCL